MATVTLYPIKDGSIGNSNRGTATTIYASSSYSGSNDYMMIDFDWSQIPTGSIINSATLYLSVTFWDTQNGNNGLGANSSIRRITSQWTEANLTHTNASGEYETRDITNNHSSLNVTTTVANIKASGGYGLEINVTNAGNSNGDPWYTTLYVNSREFFGGNNNAYRLDVTYTVPNAAPNAPAPQTPAQGGWYNIGNPTVSWTFSDPDAGNYQGAWAVHIIDNNTNVVVRDTGLVGGGATSWVISPALPSGTYRYRIIVQDQSGAQSNWSWEPYFYVDTVAPTGNARTGQQYVNTSPIRIYADNVSDANGISYVDVFMLNAAQSSWAYLGRATQSGSTWYYDFPVSNDGQANRQTLLRAVDPAGNTVDMITWVYYDTVAPLAINLAVSNVKATTATITWNAFNDPAPSSGWNHTFYYLEQWNGSAWVRTVDSLSIGNVSTRAITGLTAGTLYRTTIHQFDNAGNYNPLVWVQFTTNTLPVTTLTSLAAAGYLINQRPKIKATLTDANGDILTDYAIQISNVSDFSTTVVNTTKGASAAGWSATSVANGGSIIYTPQIDIGTGTKYVRMQAFDGKDWGAWTAAIAITVNAPGWATTVNAADTGVRKPTIDDLRTKVNAIRQARGLAVTVWTDPAITAGVTNIRDDHINELRTSLQEVATLFGVTLTWTNANVTNALNRSGQDWLDLRNRAVTL